MEVRKTAAGRRRTLMMGVAGGAALRCAASASPSCRRGVCEECVRSVDPQRAPPQGLAPHWPPDEPRLAQPACGKRNLQTCLLRNHLGIFPTTFRGSEECFPSSSYLFIFFLFGCLKPSLSPLLRYRLTRAFGCQWLPSLQAKGSGTLQLDSNRLPWRCLCLEKRPDLFVVVSLLVSPLGNSSGHE